VLAGQGATNNWLIDRCDITHPAPQGGHYCMVARGSRWTISNCNLSNYHDYGLGGHPSHEGIIVTAPVGIQSPAYAAILNNHLQFCGLGMAGHHMLVQGNTITECGLGAFFHGGALNDPEITHTNSYINNISQLNQQGLDDTQNAAFQQVGGFEIWAPYTFFFGNSAHDNCGPGYSVGGHHSIVAFNRAISNGRIPATPDARQHHVSGFSARSLLPAGEQQVNASNSIFFGNVATDTKPAAQKTQDYGMIVQTDWIRCVAFIANNLHGNNLGEGFYRNCQPNVNQWIGNDLLNNICDAKQQEILRSLFNTDTYALQEAQYLLLNQLFTGSSLDRPVPPTLANAASNLNAFQFTAHWTHNSSATGYQLSVASDSGFNNEVTGYNNLDVGNVISRVVNVPSSDEQTRTYYYRVRGYNAGGNGPYSNIISVNLPLPG
jgi:hypothetical protein